MKAKLDRRCPTGRPEIKTRTGYERCRANGRRNMAEMRTSFQKTEMDGQPWLLNSPRKVEASEEEGNESRLP
jgi:hypothetical protein